MSIEAIQWALYLPHKNPTHKAVLIGMANHANPDGKNCYPSIDRLEKYTGLGRSTIIRAIRQMEELGILTADKQHGRLSKYDLNMEWEPENDQCQSGTSAAAALVPERSKVVPQRDKSSAAAALKPYLTVHNRNKGEGARGSRLPPGWTLPADWWDWAAQEGLAGDAIDQQAARFHDYWTGRAGQGGVKLDWFATWRNWCRRELDEQRRRGPPKTGRSALMDELLRRANEPAH